MGGITVTFSVTVIGSNRILIRERADKIAADYFKSADFGLINESAIVDIRMDGQVAGYTVEFLYGIFNE